MRFEELALPGAFLIHPEPIADDRGWFARTWCQDEFRRAGLNPTLAQCSVSFNHRQGTLRGMHFQAAPFEETKLVRCTRGALYDVLLDLRPDSDTFQRWQAVELSQDDHALVYVPEGCAHGFQTLVDDTEVFYQISRPYEPSAARGVRWDDPSFRIEWPSADPILSTKDRRYPDFRA